MASSFQIVRKVLQIVSFYLLPVGLLATSLSGYVAWDFYSQLGQTSWIIITVIIFLTPAAEITDWRLFKSIRLLRRELGVAAFWLFLFHAGGLMYTGKLFNFASYLKVENGLFWGAVAGIGMILLGLTSNNISVRLLKKNWKRLQRIAIPVYFLISIHKFIASDEGLIPVLVIFVVYVVLRGAGHYMAKLRQKNLDDIV